MFLDIIWIYFFDRVFEGGKWEGIQDQINRL